MIQRYFAIVIVLFTLATSFAASGSDVCQGQATPACRHEFIGSWQGNWADSGNATAVLGENGTATIEFVSPRGKTTGTWKLTSAKSIALTDSQRPDHLFEVEVLRAGDVLTLRYEAGDIILVPVETPGTSERSKLPPGVWTLGNKIIGRREKAPLTKQFLKAACANAFIISHDDGARKYYYLDHKASGHHHLTYVRQGECQSSGKGHDTCAFRWGGKAKVTESAPQYFPDGDALLYKDALHPDWPMQRLHRCPFTAETVSPFTDGMQSGQWSPALKSWTDLHADITSKDVMGAQDLIVERVDQFYDIVDPESRKAQ